MNEENDYKDYKFNNYVLILSVLFIFAVSINLFGLLFSVFAVLGWIPLCYSLWRVNKKLFINGDNRT